MLLTLSKYILSVRPSGLNQRHDRLATLLPNWDPLLGSSRYRVIACPKFYQLIRRTSLLTWYTRHKSSHSSSRHIIKRTKDLRIPRGNNFSDALTTLRKHFAILFVGRTHCNCPADCLNKNFRSTVHLQRSDPFFQPTTATPTVETISAYLLPQIYMENIEGMSFVLRSKLQRARHRTRSYDTEMSRRQLSESTA